MRAVRTHGFGFIAGYSITWLNLLESELTVYDGDQLLKLVEMMQNITEYPVAFIVKL